MSEKTKNPFWVVELKEVINGEFNPRGLYWNGLKPWISDDEVLYTKNIHEAKKFPHKEDAEFWIEVHGHYAVATEHEIV